MDFFSGGYVGVDVFFVISGYLITTIILTEKRAGTFTIGNFYERRARRILPALFFVMLACMPLAWRWMTPVELRDFSESIIAVSFFYSNVFFWLESGYFETAAELKPLLHTWSLAVEEQYYLLFPLFIMAAWRYGLRSILWMLALIGLASLLLAQWGSVSLPVSTYYLLPTRLWELLIGSLVAIHLLDRAETSSYVRGRASIAAQALSACGLVLICYAIVVFDAQTPFPGFYALLPTVGTALIIVFGTRTTFTGRLLGNKLLVGIGLISYSAYLWHQPLFAFGRISTIGTPSPAHLIVLGVLALGFAYLTWRYVEQPFRNRQLIRRRTILGGACVMIVAFGVTGLAGQYSSDKFDRFGPDQLQALASIEQLKEERRELTGSGGCYFRSSAGADIEHFLDDWNCGQDADSTNLRPIPVVVAGDSHAADIVVALKMNGYLPLQIGGTGCSLNPEFMTDTCQRIFSKLRGELRRDSSFEFIVLANRYSKNELSLPAMARTIDYWEEFGLKIALFTAMPTFDGIDKAILLSKPAVPDFEIADYSARSELVDYLTERGVHVINRKRLFCSITSSCDFRGSDEQLLLVDYDHFSRGGAQQFGEHLFAEDDWFKAVISKLH